MGFLRRLSEPRDTISLARIVNRTKTNRYVWVRTDLHDYDKAYKVSLGKNISASLGVLLRGSGAVRGGYLTLHLKKINVLLATGSEIIPLYGAILRKEEQKDDISTSK